MRKEDAPRVPRSLFDRPSKLVKLKQQQLMKPFSKPTPMLGRPIMDQSHDHPEWLIHEDWALLQVSLVRYLPHSKNMAQNVCIQSRTGLELHYVRCKIWQRQCHLVFVIEGFTLYYS